MLLKSTQWIIGFTLLFVNTASISEIYKWVDENGNTHFSEQPPPRSQTEFNAIKAQEIKGTVNFINNENKKKTSKRKQIRKKKKSKNKERDNDQQKFCQKKYQKLVELEHYLLEVKTIKDQQKAKRLRTLIRKECPEYVKNNTFYSSSKSQQKYCVKKKQSLAELESFYQQNKNLRDEKKINSLRSLIKQECK